jgi:hypothetical protein
MRTTWRNTRKWYRLNRRRWQGRIDGLMARFVQVDPEQVERLTFAKPRAIWLAHFIGDMCASPRNSPLTLEIKTNARLPHHIADQIVACRLIEETAGV